MTSECSYCGTEFGHDKALTIHLQQYQGDGTHPKLSRGKYVKAGFGYHGYILNPTHFLIGERGPERVDISPRNVRRKKDPMDILDYGKAYLDDYSRGY